MLHYVNYLNLFVIPILITIFYCFKFDSAVLHPNTILNIIILYLGLYSKSLFLIIRCIDRMNIIYIYIHCGVVAKCSGGADRGDCHRFRQPLKYIS